MNEQFIRDVTKAVKETKLNQVLEPGATPRRYTPASGEKKHNERIHRESKIADNKNLPFTFNKPKKPGRSSYFSCNNCGYVFNASVNTIGVVCNECKKFSTCSELPDENEKD
jgi:rubrerythrin